MSSLNVEIKKRYRKAYLPRRTRRGRTHWEPIVRKPFAGLFESIPYGKKTPFPFGEYKLPEKAWKPEPPQPPERTVELSSPWDPPKDYVVNFGEFRLKQALDRPRPEERNLSIANARKSLGWSQLELARRANVPLACVVDLETRPIYPLIVKDAVKVAECLGLNADFALDLGPNQGEPK